MKNNNSKFVPKNINAQRPNPMGAIKKPIGKPTGVVRSVPNANAVLKKPVGLNGGIRPTNQHFLRHNIPVNKMNKAAMISSVKPTSTSALLSSSSQTLFGISKKAAIGGLVGISAVVGGGAGAGLGISNAVNNDGLFNPLNPTTSSAGIKHVDAVTGTNTAQKVNADVRYIGDLDGAYYDRAKGIVNVDASSIKVFDQSRIADAYYGANGVIGSKEKAAKTLLPDYKLVKKYTYNGAEKMYDSVADLQNQFWNNVSEKGVGFYIVKDHSGKENYFNPLNSTDVARFKKFAATELLKANKTFDLEYYIPQTDKQTESSYIPFSKSSAIFSDEGNFTLNSNANLGTAFDQKINSLFLNQTNDLLQKTHFSPTISIPSNPIEVTHRRNHWFDAYKEGPKFGFDRYFGVGIKTKDDKSWDDVKISNSVKVEKGFVADEVIENLSKIANNGSIASNFEAKSLKQRYERKWRDGYQVADRTLSASASAYNLSLKDEQENLKGMIASDDSHRVYRNQSNEDVSKELDLKFLKTHAHINNLSFVSKDDNNFFGESLGLIYKGNLYAATVKNDASVAKDWTRGGTGEKTFTYHDTFSNNSWWLNSGNFDKAKFVENSKYYFGFGEVKNANTAYGTYPESVGISNNTVQVGADIFDFTTGRRNAKDIVHDIKTSSNWTWNSNLTFLPGYWESYRISQENRRLYLNVDFEFKLNDKTYKSEDLLKLKYDVAQKYGLDYQWNNDSYSIKKDSDFYKQYLNQAYANGEETYKLFADLGSFKSINNALDANFLNLAKKQVAKYVTLFEKSLKTFSLGNGNSTSLDDFKKELENLKTPDSSLNRSEINLSDSKSNEFLYKKIVEEKKIKPVITFGNDKQPLFQLDLSKPEQKQRFDQIYVTNNRDVKKALATYMSQIDVKDLAESLINLSNHVEVDANESNPVFTYDLKKQIYFTKDSETNEIKLETKYDTSINLTEPDIPRDTNQSQYTKLVSDGNNWFATTYLWKLYQNGTNKFSAEDKQKFASTLFTDPNDFFVLKGSTNSEYDLYYGQYFQITKEHTNVSLDPNGVGNNLFFDSYAKKQSTRDYASNLITGADIAKNYQIAYYYLSETNEQLGLTIGDNRQDGLLQEQARNSALAELNPKLASGIKVYKNEDGTESSVKDAIFNLYPYATKGGYILYFDTKENLDNYTRNL